MAGIVGLVVTASRPTGIAVAIQVGAWSAERANQDRREQAEVTDSVRVAAGGADDRVGSSSDGSSGEAGRPAKRSFVRELGRRFGPRAFPRQASPVFLSFAGLAGWCAYLYYRFGDALLFVDAEGAWHQGAGPRTWFKYEFFTKIHQVPHSIFADSLMLHAFLGVAVIFLVPLVARRFGGLRGLRGLVMGIPLLGTKDFMSCGRYLLAAFPVFAAVGLELAGPARRWPRRIWFTVSASILTVMCCWWAMGKYIS
jgi:hypothetical protein